MSLQDLKNRMADYAKDTKLNLGKVMEEEGAPGLSRAQILTIALASAYATKQAEVIAAIEAEAMPVLSAEAVQAAKAAATIMGMNNIYYRFVHLVDDKDYKSMPANLRMNVIANPGIPKVDFELASLAVSAINGCGMCLEAHVHEVIKAGIGKQGVQSTIRIASVLHAAAQAVIIESLSGSASLSHAA